MDMNKFLNKEYQHVFANAILWVLSNDVITIAKLKNHFGLNDIDTRKFFVIMKEMGLIENNPDDAQTAGIYYVIANYADLPVDAVNLLHEYGFSDNKIKEALKGQPRDKKTITSNILRDSKYSWTKCTDKMPLKGLPVAIRLVDSKKIAAESRSELMYLEDIKIAYWDGYNWKIEPPFPLYDLSLLSDHENLKTGAIVSHWASVTNNDLENWEHRFDAIHQYSKLHIEVDEVHQKSIYMALLLAVGALRREAELMDKNSPDYAKMIEAAGIMYDLMHSMDNDIQ